jgi:hypothetical protein
MEFDADQDMQFAGEEARISSIHPEFRIIPE